MIEEFTPEKASKVLESHVNYRGLRKHRVSQYARIMSARKWQIGPPLCFDTDGILVDGEHRLRAVVLSGKTVEFNVLRNIPPKSNTSFDTGLLRRGSDALRASGVAQDHLTMRSSLLKLMHTAGRVNYKALNTITSDEPELYQIYAKAIDFIVDCFPTNIRGITRAGVIVCWGRAYLAFPQEEMRLREAADKYQNLKFETKEDSGLRVLARYTTGATSKVQGSDQQKTDYFKAAGALKNWLDRKPLEKLYFSSIDPFPLPKRIIERERQFGFEN